jgi:hypothetical protein
MSYYVTTDDLYVMTTDEKGLPKHVATCEDNKAATQIAFALNLVEMLKHVMGRKA